VQRIFSLFCGGFFSPNLFFSDNHKHKKGEPTVTSNIAYKIQKKPGVPFFLSGIVRARLLQ
jgi:hypothetical protein